MVEFEGLANPATVLELIAEIERLETQVRLAGVSAEVTVHQEVGRAVTRELALTAERDQLKAENEALRKDAERYRFLRQHGPVHSARMLDEQIDAAITKATPK
jgi:hypothetical protein